jgi:hypothetical protein
MRISIYVQTCAALAVKVGRKRLHPPPMARQATSDKFLDFATVQL